MVKYNECITMFPTWCFIRSCRKYARSRIPFGFTPNSRWRWRWAEIKRVEDYFQGCDKRSFSLHTPTILWSSQWSLKSGVITNSKTKQSTIVLPYWCPREMSAAVFFFPCPLAAKPVSPLICWSSYKQKSGSFKSAYLTVLDLFVRNQGSSQEDSRIARIVHSP